MAEPVATGVLVIDALFAIGRGQRELIIGERQTGKTALAVDTMVNQASGEMICIHVAISQRMGAVRRVVQAIRAPSPAPSSWWPRPHPSPACAGWRRFPRPAWTKGSATGASAS